MCSDTDLGRSGGNPDHTTLKSRAANAAARPNPEHERYLSLETVGFVIDAPGENPGAGLRDHFAMLNNSSTKAGTISVAGPWMAASKFETPSEGSKFSSIVVAPTEAACDTKPAAG